MPRCKAVQYSDEMNCVSCGLVWDVNDPDPPACRRLSDREELEERLNAHAEKNRAELAKRR